MNTNAYANAYNDNDFWGKCRGVVRIAGRGVLYPALCLGYALHRPHTPVWAKATIVGALGYFISPIDAVPDVLPLVGYSDDAAVLAAAMAAVAFCIDAEVRAQAERKLSDWGL